MEAKNYYKQFGTGIYSERSEELMKMFLHMMNPVFVKASDHEYKADHTYTDSKNVITSIFSDCTFEIKQYDKDSKLLADPITAFSLRKRQFDDLKSDELKTMTLLYSENPSPYLSKSNKGEVKLTFISKLDRFNQKYTEQKIKGTFRTFSMLCTIIKSLIKDEAKDLIISINTTDHLVKINTEADKVYDDKYKCHRIYPKLACNKILKSESFEVKLTPNDLTAFSEFLNMCLKSKKNCKNFEDFIDKYGKDALTLYQGTINNNPFELESYPIIHEMYLESLDKCLGENADA